MAPIHDPISKLPRGKGIRLNFAQIMRIAMVATVLVALMIMQRPCADAVSKFVTGMDKQREPAGTPATTGPDPYAGQVVDTKGMTDEQVKAAVQKARQGN